MAKYTSRYAELGFYVNNELRQFSAGEFTTESPDEIAALDKLADAVRVDKPEEPAAKAPTTRKASARSSAD